MWGSKRSCGGHNTQLGEIMYCMRETVDDPATGSLVLHVAHELSSGGSLCKNRAVIGSSFACTDITLKVCGYFMLEMSLPAMTLESTLFVRKVIDESNCSRERVSESKYGY